MPRFTVTLIITVIAIGMIPAVPSVASSAIRAGQIRHATAADFASGTSAGVAISTAGDGELVLADQRNQGQFTSPILKTTFEFSAVGINWTDDRPELTQVDIEIRTSRDGKVWKDWHIIEDGDIPSKLDQHASDLFFTMGNYVQYRVTLTANEQEQTPVLKDITVKYIDSTSGPDLAAARASTANALGPIPSSQPFIISRAAWGSPEPYSSVNWPPEYAETQTAIVHHTDTPMDTDPVVAVRAIWYDHAVLKGWGDIGYNYLIDTFGNIYEGRFGGDNVVAGHAGSPYNYGSIGVALIGTYISTPPSAQALSSSADLLAWKFAWHRLDPIGSGWFWDKYVDNVMGHRDVGITECPGGALYGQLAGVRNLAKFREGWWSHSTPQRMLPGQTVGVSVDVQNKGTQTWYPGGSNSFDLGYHWYFPDGTQYVQAPGDDRRTSVPWPVGYDQRVTINALLTAPSLPGTYKLEWDMVQENVAWFTSLGNIPLAATVVVEQSTPTSTPTWTPTPVPPILNVDHTSIGFLTVPEATPRPQVVLVQNAGTGTFSWTASPSSEAGWLKVDPLSGGQPGTFTVSVDQAALGSGPPSPALFQGSIVVQAYPETVLGSPQNIPVRLVIADRIYSTYLPLAYRAYPSGW